MITNHYEYWEMICGLSCNKHIATLYDLQKFKVIPAVPFVKLVQFSGLVILPLNSGVSRVTQVTAAGDQWCACL